MTHEALLDRESLDELLRELNVRCGKRVRERRRALGFTQDQLADLCGTTPETISRVETGTVWPRPYLQVAIAYALAVEVPELWAAPARDEVLRRAAA